RPEINRESQERERVDIQHAWHDAQKRYSATNHARELLVIFPRHSPLRERNSNGNRKNVNLNSDSELNLDPIPKPFVTRQKIQPTTDKEESEINLDPDAKVIAEYFSSGQSTASQSHTVAADGLSNKRDSPSNATDSSDDVNLDQSDININCTRDDGTPGVCVLYYQCNTDDGQVITDGNSLIDVRLKDGACSHYLQVCCVLNVVQEKPVILEDKVPDVPAKSKKCGWNNPALNIFQTRETAGLDDGIYANYGDFPWMIAVIRNRNETEEWSKNDYLGGGFLIHPAVVVTAAHKVEQYNPHQKLFNGSSLLRSNAVPGSGTLRPTHNFRMFSSIASLYNDIAVLFLKSPFSLNGSPNINVACVGASMPPPGTLCFSMGWGANFKKKNVYAVILKKVRLPLVDPERCETLLRKTRLGPFFRLDKSLTCAGGEDGVDTCRGDGGSSLVCPVQMADESTRYEVFGMVAYGIGCGSKDVPSVYVNIPYLKPWLDAIIASEGLSTETYIS
ncbi:serine proteinase protein 1b, partial [Danaus plexippus plexippus]